MLSIPGGFATWKDYNNQIDIFFNIGYQTLKIYNRWLDPGAVYYQLRCRPDMEYILAASGPFFYNHISKSSL